MKKKKATLNLGRLSTPWREFRPQLTKAGREKLNMDSAQRVEDWLAEGSEIEVIPSFEVPAKTRKAYGNAP